MLGLMGARQPTSGTVRGMHVVVDVPSSVASAAARTTPANQVVGGNWTQTLLPHPRAAQSQRCSSWLTTKPEPSAFSSVT